MGGAGQGAGSGNEQFVALAEDEERVVGMIGLIRRTGNRAAVALCEERVSSGG